MEIRSFTIRISFFADSFQWISRIRSPGTYSLISLTSAKSLPRSVLSSVSERPVIYPSVCSGRTGCPDGITQISSCSARGIRTWINPMISRTAKKRPEMRKCPRSEIWSGKIRDSSPCSLTGILTLCTDCSSQKVFSKHTSHSASSDSHHAGFLRRKVMRTEPPGQTRPCPLPMSACIFLARYNTPAADAIGQITNKTASTRRK